MDMKAPVTPEELDEWLRFTRMDDDSDDEKTAQEQEPPHAPTPRPPVPAPEPTKLEERAMDGRKARQRRRRRRSSPDAVSASDIFDEKRRETTDWRLVSEGSLSANDDEAVADGGDGGRGGGLSSSPPSAGRGGGGLSSSLAASPPSAHSEREAVLARIIRKIQPPPFAKHRRASTASVKTCASSETVPVRNDSRRSSPSDRRGCDDVDRTRDIDGGNPPSVIDLTRPPFERADHGANACGSPPFQNQEISRGRPRPTTRPCVKDAIFAGPPGDRYCRSVSLPGNTGRAEPRQRHDRVDDGPPVAPHARGRPAPRGADGPGVERPRGDALSFLTAMERSERSQERIGRAGAHNSRRGAAATRETSRSRGTLLSMLNGGGGGLVGNRAAFGDGGHGRNRTADGGRRRDRAAGGDGAGWDTLMPPFPNYDHQFWDGRLSGQVQRDRRPNSWRRTRFGQHYDDFHPAKRGDMYHPGKHHPHNMADIQAELRRMAREQMIEMELEQRQSIY